MKFIVPGKALYACTSAASKIINAKNALTILNNFKLTLQDEILTVTASDGENFLEGRIPVGGVEGSGSVCVDAKRLVELLRELPDVGISFVVDPDMNYAITVEYANGEFKFMGFDGDEFPEADSQPEAGEAAPIDFTISSGSLIRGIDNTLFAVGSDELRPQMTGILLDIFEEEFVFAATDTRKLVKFTDKAIKPGARGSFILPTKSAVVLKNVFAKESEIRISMREKGITFDSDGFTFNSRLIKGRFPDYNRVIPQNNPYTLTVDRPTLQSAVRRIGFFGNTDNGLIRFKLEQGRMILKACENGYNSSAWESVSCDYEGKDMVIGFSGPYTSEILATIRSNDVVMELCDPSRPGLFKPSENEDDTELIMLLMPMLVAEF